MSMDRANKHEGADADKHEAGADKHEGVDAGADADNKRDGADPAKPLGVAMAIDTNAPPSPGACASHSDGTSAAQTEEATQTSLFGTLGKRTHSDGGNFAAAIRYVEELCRSDAAQHSQPSQPPSVSSLSTSAAPGIPPRESDPVPSTTVPSSRHRPQQGVFLHEALEELLRDHEIQQEDEDEYDEDEDEDDADADADGDDDEDDEEENSVPVGPALDGIRGDLSGRRNGACLVDRLVWRKHGLCIIAHVYEGGLYELTATLLDQPKIGWATRRLTDCDWQPLNALQSALANTSGPRSDVVVEGGGDRLMLSVHRPASALGEPHRVTVFEHRWKFRAISLTQALDARICALEIMDSKAMPTIPFAVRRQEEALGQQSNPLGQQSNPLGQQSNPLGQQSNPLGQQSNPLGQQSNPLGQQSNPVGPLSAGWWTEQDRIHPFGPIPPTLWAAPMTSHADISTRHGDISTRHGGIPTRHGGIATRLGDIPTRHGDIPTPTHPLRVFHSPVPPLLALASFHSAVPSPPPPTPQAPSPPASTARAPSPVALTQGYERMGVSLSNIRRSLRPTLSSRAVVEKRSDAATRTLRPRLDNHAKRFESIPVSIGDSGSDDDNGDESAYQ